MTADDCVTLIMVGFSGAMSVVAACWIIKAVLEGIHGFARDATESDS